ncbi:MAG TPA: adenylate/guanylate cyclase domain-containing protein [Leptospiraceae bacterium]|nr:adenylate/guanylate cyclase domain-containing protein [Leptospiraceae bacterium]HNF25076.1 adenylate/guanylate cyclase domain-containing protein [Leptospiraceae bacterium]
MNRILKKLNIGAVLFLILCQTLFANPFPKKSAYLEKVFTSTDGLSHNIVSSIVQDKKGYLWIGTYGGLNRYDGFEFRNFNMRDGLAFDAIRSLAATDDGALWIGTEKGLNRFKDEKFELFTVEQSGKGLAGNDISAVRADAKGNLFVGTITGLSVYRNGKFERISLLENDSETVQVNFIHTDAKGLTWVGTKKHGLFILQEDRILKQLKIPQPNEGANSKSESAELISADSDSNETALIVSTKDKGVFIVIYNNFEAVPLTEYDGGKFYSEDMNGMIICKNPKDRKISFMSQKKKSFIFEDSRYKVLEEKNLQACFVDREGTFWIGTYGLGLVKHYRPRAIGITKEDGLKDLSIRFIFKDSKERLWLGTQNNITQFAQNSVPDEKPFAVRKIYENDSNGNPISKVRWILEDKKGRVWFGTDDRLLFFQNGNLMPAELKDIKKISIYSMCEYMGRIYIATKDKKLYSFDPDTMAFYRHPFPGDMKLGVIWKLTKDHESKVLYIQGSDAVWKYSMDSEGNDSFQLFISKDMHKMYKIQNFEIYSEQDYILSDDSVIIRSRDKDIPAVIGTDQGLPSDQVVSIARTEKGDIWIGTSRGVVRYADGRIVSVYNKADGLVGDFSHFNSIFADSRHVLVGTSEGLSVIDLSDPHKNGIKPESVFTKIVTSGRKQIFELNGTVTLEPEDSSIHLFASSLSLSNPEKTRYSFSLSEDSRGSFLKNNTASYYNLSPGKYRFYVRSMNDDGVSSETAGSLEVNVLPAVWQTNWFRGLCVIVLLAVFYSIYRVRVYQMRLQNIRLEGLVRDRTKELQAEKEVSENLLLNILPKSIADKLKAGESKIADSFHEVTVLFADIVGFTKMSQTISAMELVSKLNDLFSHFDRAVLRLNVEKIKTIGDCYMAVGGLPVERKDHAEVMMLFALEILDEVRSFNEKYNMNLSVRIGLNTGEVVAGVIGEHKFIYDLWGDAVNTASRMESSGVPGRIHVSEATYLRLCDKYSFTSRGDIEVKGKGKMRTYLLN